MNTIATRIKKCIADREGIGIDLNENARLKEDVGLDSLSLAAVIVELEEEFSIIFDESDLEPANIKTVNDLFEMVRRHL